MRKGRLTWAAIVLTVTMVAGWLLFVGRTPNSVSWSSAVPQWAGILIVLTHVWRRLVQALKMPSLVPLLEAVDRWQRGVTSVEGEFTATWNVEAATEGIHRVRDELEHREQAATRDWWIEVLSALFLVTGVGLGLWPDSIACWLNAAIGSA